MKFDKMDVADLLADESFVNYCKGTPADVTFWENFVKENPDRKHLVENARERFIELFHALSQADLDEQVARLQNRMNALNGVEQAPVVQMEVHKTIRPRKNLSWILKLSAAAVLFSAVFFTIRYFTNNRKADKIFLASFGERKNIQLPDGTDVTLNAGSKIEIKGNFGSATRDVYLQGEAFFDVKHNDKLPFIVHTPAMDVKALGTAFNVKAYQEETITETSLIRGLIEITLKENNNRTMLLYPNQKLQWDHTLSKTMTDNPYSKEKAVDTTANLVKKLSITDDGNIREVAWKENKLMFEDELFADIAILLERWYGVHIQFKDNTIRNYRFTGIFEKEGIMTILDLMKESKPFTYKIESDEPMIISLSK